MKRERLNPAVVDVEKPGWRKNKTKCIFKKQRKGHVHSPGVFTTDVALGIEGIQSHTGFVGFTPCSYSISVSKNKDLK